jgi:LysR family glycine cleavage system transcriptional activator
MRRRMPPLNALRAFEAAARHLSFTRAADELAVTQAAISHQIKALEATLGVQLFVRRNRTLRLTDAGQSYLPALTGAFDAIDAATRRLAQVDRAGVLTVSVLPSFAAKWLVPRLGRFRERHPDIDVHIAPKEELTQFDRDDVDVGVRYGGGNWPGLRVVRFLTEDVFPVCSPRLQAGPVPLETPDDLRHHTFLHDDDPIGLLAWPEWLRMAGITDIDTTRGVRFRDASHMVQAAIDGLGVALGRTALVADDLAAGRLIRPFAISRPATFAYYVVTPEAWAERPKIRAFMVWLVETARAGGQRD